MEWTAKQQGAINAVQSWLLEGAPGGVYRLFGFAGTGKALRFDQHVQTPTGPTRIQDVAVGDRVYGADGRLTSVIGVYPQGKRQSYRITFRDRTTVECDAEHLWVVQTHKLRSNGRRTKTMTLREIMDAGLRFSSGSYKFYMPLCSPVQYEERRFLIHPYILGALVGDGTMMGQVPSLCLPDEKQPIADRVSDLLPDWAKLTFSRKLGCNQHRITDPRHYHQNEIRDELVAMELDCKSPDRFVPHRYMLGSVDQRWELLRGLMDTDGSCVRNRTSYTTSSERLADDVVTLVQSLGGTAIKKRYNRAQRGVEFHINVKVFDRNPFYLPRKADRWSPSTKNGPSRAIVSVVPTDIADHVCIKVAADDGLFLTNGFVVTHNTTIAKTIAERVSGEVVFATFTGKAALVLNSKGCYGARTIHSLIYIPRAKCSENLKKIREKMENETDEDRQRELMEEFKLERANLKRPAFNLNLDSDLRDASLLILDEVSMVDMQIGQDLESFQVPILALGDPAQLPPVKGSGYFTNIAPDYLLEEIHRQAEGSGILSMATAVRQGRTLSYQDDEDARVVPKGTCTTADMAEFDQIICGTNKVRRAVNRRIREELGRTSPLPEIGDRIICLRNDQESGLLNGSQWDVCGVEQSPNDEDKLLLTIAAAGDEDAYTFTVTAHKNYFLGTEDEISHYDIRTAQCFDYAYAITCHKAQGSQWPRVVIINESGVFRNDASRWLYTAVTRAAEKVTVIQ